MRQGISEAYYDLYNRQTSQRARHMIRPDVLQFIAGIMWLTWILPFAIAVR